MAAELYGVDFGGHFVCGELDMEALKVKKAKLLEIDLLRMIAIVAVVLIHATAEATARVGQSPLALQEGSSTQILMVAINRVGLFAVPMFLLVSSLVLFYQYYDKWSMKECLSFYRKRILSVLVPYLLFSFFYYIYNQLLVVGPIKVEWGKFFELIQWADTSYHLYFMIIILQFYVVFPLLLTLVKLSSFLRRWLIPVGIAVQGTFYTLGHWYIDIDHKPSLAITYTALFCFGAYVGIHYGAVSKWVERHRLWVWPVSMLLVAAVPGLFLNDRYGHLFVENTWFEIVGLANVLLLSLVLLQWGKRLAADKPSLYSWVHKVSRHSFGIYLLHPAFLSLYRISMKPVGGPRAYLLFTVIGFLFSLLGSLVVSELYQYGVRKMKAMISGNRGRSVAGGKNLSA